VEISENSAIDDNIGLPLNGADVDSGLFGSIRYEIVEGNVLNCFRINAKTGQLFVNTAKNLDYEAQAYFPLTIRVTDAKRAGLKEESTVLVKILDINDAPLVRPSVRKIFENTPPGSLVGTAIMFSDQDASDGHRFAISQPNCWHISVPPGVI
jgi:hypothetical protein